LALDAIDSITGLLSSQPPGSLSFSIRCMLNKIIEEAVKDVFRGESSISQKPKGEGESDIDE